MIPWINSKKWFILFNTNVSFCRVVATKKHSTERWWLWLNHAGIRLLSTITNMDTGWPWPEPITFLVASLTTSINETIYQKEYFQNLMYFQFTVKRNSETYTFVDVQWAVFHFCSSRTQRLRMNTARIWPFANGWTANNLFVEAKPQKFNRPVSKKITSKPYLVPWYLQSR